MITGANLVGGNPKSGRTNLDYYATNPEAVRMLLKSHHFDGGKILEPCVGGGHIANVLREEFPNGEFTFVDIVDRGYPSTTVCDFLGNFPDKNVDKEINIKYNTIITNPPYSLANQFIRKCWDLLEDGGKMAMFLRINFLEGVGRQQLFEDVPLRYVYVFRKRMEVFNNGLEKNPATGERWATTLCNGWYVWEKTNNISEPVIRWI